MRSSTSRPGPLGVKAFLEPLFEAKDQGLGFRVQGLGGGFGGDPFRGRFGFGLRHSFGFVRNSGSVGSGASLRSVRFRV